MFFDQLGISWEYEAQGYTVGPFGRRRPYLPDFYLPAQQIWVEVKGSINDLRYSLLVDAADPRHGLAPPADADWELQQVRLIVLGTLPRTGYLHNALSVIGGEVVAAQSVVAACVPEAGTHAFLTVGCLVRASDDWSSERSAGLGATPLVTREAGFTVCEHVQEAYVAARSARFEHGESGAPAGVAMHGTRSSQAIAVAAAPMQPTAIQRDYAGPKGGPLRPPPAIAAADISAPLASPLSNVDAAAIRQLWPEVLTRVAGKSRKMTAILREAIVVTVEQNTLTLAFRHHTHAAMLGAAPEMLEDTLHQLIGERWMITCIVAEPKTRTQSDDVSS
ncbi:PDDEXK family nuclease [Dactylosporangium darangshiense]|uniref:hypothetical protein n=1 Tax=Dactylosporangium darangshiense TaxID=579108 RepID=UPI0031ED18CE